jgi:hypothetical protein
MPRTITDILPPSRRRPVSDDVAPTQTTDLPPPPQNTSPAPLPASMPPKPPLRVQIRSGKSFPYGTALIALVVVALSAGALYALGDARVEVTPTTQSGTINGSFTATAGSGDLPYTSVTVTKTTQVAVPAESTLTANDSAQGTIVISNAQAKAQTLIVNTRFQSPAGLIYHIHAPVTIPAQSAAGPGTVTATVFADQPGVSYNIPPTTFTVPGLKGGPTYTLVTAQSSDSMSGGFTGTRASVSQATDDSKHAALQTSLAASLAAAIAAKVPAGSILVSGASTMTFQPLPDSATTTASVTVGEQGTETAVVFPESALAKALAYKIVGTYAGEPVMLTSTSSLMLSPSSASTTPSTSGNYNFTLSGPVTISWVVDPAHIAGAVAGKTRDAAQNILRGFPEVNKAVFILRPFWASTFPQDPTHIKIVVTPPAAAK